MSDNTPKQPSRDKVLFNIFGTPATAADLQSAAFWKAQFSKPAITGIAASVILLLMKLIGMMPVHFVIILLPAVAGIVIQVQTDKKKKQPPAATVNEPAPDRDPPSAPPPAA